MSLNLSNLTDSAQKEYSKFIKDMNHQKGVIEKCRAYAKECPSDALKRAKAGYEHNKKQLEDHDTILEARIERMIKKLREEGALDREAKEKYLAASEQKLETLENETSRTEVSAKKELEKLKKAFESFKERVLGNPIPQITQPPSGGMCKMETPLPDQEGFVEQKETSEIDDSEMMKAFRQEMPEKPLTFITNNFSYCSRSEAKEINKGMQGLIPAGTNYDSSIYGPVATLKRPVKSVKKV
jgi:hypothetical protein